MISISSESSKAASSDDLLAYRLVKRAQARGLDERQSGRWADGSGPPAPPNVPLQAATLATYTHSRSPDRPLFTRGLSVPGYTPPMLPATPRVRRWNTPLWENNTRDLRHRLGAGVHRVDGIDDTLDAVGPMAVPRMQPTPLPSWLANQEPRVGQPPHPEVAREVARRYREWAEQHPPVPGPSGRLREIFMPAGHEDSHEMALAHEMVHAYDPRLSTPTSQIVRRPDGSGFHIGSVIGDRLPTFEHEIPAIVAENNYLMQKGGYKPHQIAESATGRDRPIFGTWIQNHMKRYGPQLNPDTPEVTSADEAAIREWITNLRDPSHRSGRQYSNWLNTADRAFTEQHSGRHPQDPAVRSLREYMRRLRADAATGTLLSDDRYPQAARDRARAFVSRQD